MNRSGNNPRGAYVTVRLECETYAYVASHDAIPTPAQIVEMARTLPDGEYRLITYREFMSLPIKPQE